MSEQFIVELRMKLYDASEVWDRLARVQSLLRAEFDSRPRTINWEARDTGRVFSRSSLKELREAVAPFDPEHRTIWTFFHDGAASFAAVEGRQVAGKYPQYSVAIDLGGSSRIAVERDARSMQALLESEGFAVERGELRNSSRDDGLPVEQVADAVAPKLGATPKLVDAPAQKSRTKRAFDFLGTHFSQVAVSVIAAVAAAAVLAWLGLNR